MRHSVHRIARDARRSPAFSPAAAVFCAVAGAGAVVAGAAASLTVRDPGDRLAVWVAVASLVAFVAGLWRGLMPVTARRHAWARARRSLRRSRSPY